MVPLMLYRKSIDKHAWIGTPDDNDLKKIFNVFQN